MAEARNETDALDAMAYDEDPDLAWSVPVDPGLPYDGEIPEDVERLAARRRAVRGRRGEPA